MPDSPYADLDRPPLVERALRHALVYDGSLWNEVTVVDQTGSTNSDLAARARHGAAEGAVLVAEEQVTGRGRLDRTWTAPPRSGLAFSMLLRPTDVPASRWPLLPLLVGLAVADAVRQIAEVDAVLKWPNDLLVDGGKLAGILAERVDSPAGPAVVVGVGLNVTTRAAELPTPTATSLALAGASVTDRDTLLRAALREIERSYFVWCDAQGDPESTFLPAYRERCDTVGRQVRVELPGSQLVGTATGVEESGQLVVETEAGQVRVGAGDVIHVR